MMQPSDPTPGEREARETLDGDWMCGHPEGDAERSAGRSCQPCVDAYTALAYQRGVMDVRKVVEQAIWSEHHPMCNRSGDAGCCGMRARNAALRDVLAALTLNGIEVRPDQFVPEGEARFYNERGILMGRVTGLEASDEKRPHE